MARTGSARRRKNRDRSRNQHDDRSPAGGLCQAQSRTEKNA